MKKNTTEDVKPDWYQYLHDPIRLAANRAERQK
jgi:hypothetical protein